MNLQKIAILIALALAVVAAFVAVPYDLLVLAVIGLVVGFSIPGDEHVRVLVSALVLQTLAGTFDALPAVGGYVTSIISGVAVVAGGAALMIVFRNIYARVKP